MKKPQNNPKSVNHEPQGEPTKGTAKRWHCVLFQDKNGIPEGWLPDFDKMFPADKLVYACWGLEKGEETKTPHYHIYIHLNAAYRLKGIQSALAKDRSVSSPYTVHCEKAIAPAEFNRNYILHEGAYKDKECRLVLCGEVGEIEKTGKGKRNDISKYDALCKDVLADIEGQEFGLKDIIRKYPAHALRNFKNLENIYNLMRNLTYTDKYKEFANELKASEKKIGEHETAIKNQQYILETIKGNTKEELRKKQVENDLGKLKKVVNAQKYDIDHMKKILLQLAQTWEPRDTTGEISMTIDVKQEDLSGQ